MMINKQRITLRQREASPPPPPPPQHNITSRSHVKFNNGTGDLIHHMEKRPIRHALFTHVFGTPARTPPR